MSVSDGGTLQISVAELNAIKDTDTGLSAAYAIYDESSAIQSVADSVDIAALQKLVGYLPYQCWNRGT